MAIINALAHAAGKLMRKTAQPALRVGDAEGAEKFASPDHGILPVRALVRGDGFGNLASTENTGLKAHHRLLEDHCDFVATDVAHLPPPRPPRKIGEVSVTPAELDGAGVDHRRWRSRLGRMMARLVTDLPEADSPTTATVWPRSTVSEMPSTAVSVTSSVLKRTLRRSTSSSCSRAVRSVACDVAGTQPDPARMTSIS